MFLGHCFGKFPILFARVCSMRCCSASGSAIIVGFLMAGCASEYMSIADWTCVASRVSSTRREGTPDVTVFGRAGACHRSKFQLGVRLAHQPLILVPALLLFAAPCYLAVPYCVQFSSLRPRTMSVLRLHRWPDFGVASQ